MHFCKASKKRDMLVISSISYNFPAMKYNKSVMNVCWPFVKVQKISNVSGKYSSLWRLFPDDLYTNDQPAHYAYCIDLT